MTELTENSMTIPDILQPRPLERAVNVNVETQILDPVSHNYNIVSGGSTRWVFPASGILDAPNATINFEIVSGDPQNAGTDGRLSFPLWSGGLSCFRRATVRCGGNILSQVTEAGLYATVKSGYNSHDYQQNVIDVRHCSMNGAITKVLNTQPGAAANAGFLGGVAPSAVAGFSQVSNPNLDQQNIYGCQAEGTVNANVVHTKQTAKRLRNVALAGRGPEVAVRLSDIFPFFKENQLPLLAMAQVELEIEWAPSVAAATQVQDISANTVVPFNPDLAVATTGMEASFAATPFLSLDYLHYDDQERMNVMNQVQRGMTMNFREVVVTKGINPAQANVAVNGVVRSTHLIGMAGKEVQNIYVVKRPSVATQAQRNQRLNGVPYNRNDQFIQYRSVACRNEKYNCFINNQKLYNRDVSNAATAYHYLTECESKWASLPVQYDAMNYDANLNNILNNSSVLGAPNNGVNNNGETGRWCPGTKNVIGIPLMKYPNLGSAVGNGERIGSAPIEIQYECEKTLSNPAAPATDTQAQIDLTFFIEYRRSMVINPQGVTVSDL